MLVLLSQLSGLNVISLQTGRAVASTGKPIINPADLEIAAFYCASGRLGRQSAVILTRDIRQVAQDCIVIDSLDEIEDPTEIVRLKELIDRRFAPIGLTVVNESGLKLGRVEDCTVSPSTFFLQKLYVKQSLIKNLLLNNLVIDRSQIIDVTGKQIVVRDAGVKEPLMATQPAAPK